MNIITKHRTWVAAFTAVATTVAAYGEERPAYQNLRYEERGEAYRTLEPETILGRAKFISPARDGDVFLSMGGQARLRWESWENFNFNPAQDDDFLLLRLRGHADLHAGEAFRVFLEGKYATSGDRDLPGGRRTLDVDEFDVQNAFVDLQTAPGDWEVVLRLGRQELSYGAQRLVSPLDWSNTRRTWDGMRAIMKNKAWRMDAFLTRPATVEKYDFNEPDDNQTFYGVYTAHKSEDGKAGYDLYLLGLNRDDLPPGDEERVTTGARGYGVCPISGIDVETEAAWQFGDSGDKSIEAWFAAVQAGYTIADVSCKPRVQLGYDYASGDSNPEDGTVETFHQLFPLGHAYLGYIDVLGRQNVTDFSQSLSFWPVAGEVQIRVDHHVFHRAETSDAVYNVGGGILREADAGTSSDVGTEIDVTLTWKAHRHTTFAAGYSRFYAGDFIEQSGPSEDVEFMYASAQFTF